VVADRLKALLAEKSAELGMEIRALEVMPDHVHLFVESDPTRCVAEIVNCLKGYTSRVLRAEFPSPPPVAAPDPVEPELLRGSVGHVSAATIERYIAEQKGK
jgi:putative transposase